ncbi:bile acid:sodium symporter family protein [Nocardia huaxiensis]|uniref:Bile acid:sodium symporter family protein n=1 Tax=Nocardia huaxiensis TaxID=2755382 RepID=A0A7D6VGA9_9NOCA|nr:bile acid:sodium symporter family protein [Nocardia huaxiensis]QLY28970.1 bile acid:sodium symporter family protein [Nocardia huaxiensis]UFS97549.1 bile acid:sodium symporter family protein [Nocardia huaxiensis]
MNSSVVSTALPPALAVIMFGLGLSLTVADFARVTRAPKAVAIALTCQVLVLPAVAFVLVGLFDLPPLLAVGMMLLAASPGGATANLFSHLFRGDVALNVTLTAVNSLLCVVTVPLVTNLAIDRFAHDQAAELGLQFGKTMQVIAIVLVPVLIGMWVRRRAPGFAATMDRPVRIASIGILATLVFAAMLADRSALGGYFLDVGAVAALFCVLSLGIGYLVPRGFGIAAPQAIASSMEIGIHNSAVAITLAVSVLDSPRIAVPAAVYAVLMTPLAALAGTVITRTRLGAQREPAPSSPGGPA